MAGKLAVLKVLLLLAACQLLPVAAVSAAEKHKFTLVIDAGHGGHDGGACANKAKEKNINLSVALAFGKLVEANCPDVKVIYTRKTDVFVPLHQRAAIANKNKADVFISIHTNSVESRKPISGMETYTMGLRRSDEKLSAAKRENEVILIESDYKQHYAGFDPRKPESYIIFQVVSELVMAESVELAQLIQQNVCATAGCPNKGVKQDAFLVLRETSMPACLIELGYITTPSEAAYLTNQKNVDAMGKGIYKAFVAYKNKRTGKPAEPSKPSKDEEKAKETPAAKEAPAAKEVPAAKETPAAKEAPAKAADGTPAEEAGACDPIFKVQFLTSEKKLAAKDRRLKGIADADCYHEGGLWKYTVGASANYNEIYRLRKSILEQFPQAFIIAFKNGERTDAAEALKEYKKKNHIK